MGKITGFKEYKRELPASRNAKIRLDDYKEIYQEYPTDKTTVQAARCMDCGIPFCHHGCPLGNIIPEFNDAVYKEDWKEAYDILSSTNNFPEFTGRICPAPCEASCVLGLIQTPVAIEHIEKSIIEMAFEKGYVQAQPPSVRTGKKVAIVGSGPAGLAAAAQLNKAGHLVTVYERADKSGGLLRYGIPDFKLEKDVIDRRLSVMQAEGITFINNAYVGKNVSAKELVDDYDAIVLTGGATIPRDLPIPGREFKGIHFAIEFLEQNNRRVRGDSGFAHEIMATAKNVVVIGGGDTGSDCVGTSNRHKALTVTQVELLLKPPVSRDSKNPWPLWPMILRTSSSHEEGCDRNWAILTKEFTADDKGHVNGLKVVDITWKNEGGKPSFNEIQGSERVLPCDLALLAIGFMHPLHTAELAELEITLDERGNVKTNGYQTSIAKVFSAGDMRRGQSLVVWAISEGREAAREVDIFLMGESNLETKDASQSVLED